jgi:NAD(P)-dependent dehydrogenase (short-subunit alcohol dehydrogenase family)
VAIVTGSGQGIGEGIARVLAAAEARVVVNDLVPERVDEVVADLGDAGFDATGHVADVATAEGAEGLVAAAVDAYGRVDILVNNVGMARDGWLVKMSEEDWDTVLAVNLKSQFLCCRALELARYGVTANCIAPALVDTPLFRGLKEEVQERLVKSVPAGRIGTPEDIGNAALFLASDESSYVTGQTLYVCGGRSLGAG